MAAQGFVRQPRGSAPTAGDRDLAKANLYGRVIATIPGDIVVAIDGQPVEGVPRLMARLHEYAVGDTVRVTVLRDNRRVNGPVPLRGRAGRPRIPALFPMRPSRLAIPGGLRESFTAG